MATNLNVTDTKLQRLTNKIATNLNVIETTSKADKQDGHKPECYRDKTSKADKQDGHKPECYRDKTSLQRLTNKIATNLNVTETKLHFKG